MGKVEEKMIKEGRKINISSCKKQHCHAAQGTEVFLKVTGGGEKKMFRWLINGCCFAKSKERKGN
jgi:hypothetical protein